MLWETEDESFLKCVRLTLMATLIAITAKWESQQPHEHLEHMADTPKVNGVGWCMIWKDKPFQ
jgi:hypothetical protein